jgi:hypothetical protein
MSRVAGWFQTKISILVFLGLGMDNVDMYYGPLEHLTAIWYIL